MRRGIALPTIRPHIRDIVKRTGLELSRSALVAFALVIAVEGAVVHLLLTQSLAPHLRWIAWTALAVHALLFAGVARRAARAT